MEVLLQSVDSTQYELVIKTADKSTSYLLRKPETNLCSYVMGLLTATIDLGEFKIVKRNTELTIDTWHFDLTNTRDKINATKVLDQLAAM